MGTQTEPGDTDPYIGAGTEVPTAAPRAGVHAQSSRTRAVDLLVEAGAVLAGSLDPRTTMREVAKLTVPQLADICVIDLLDEDDRINDVAVSRQTRRSRMTSNSCACDLRSTRPASIRLPG